MTRQVVSTTKAPGAIGPYSQGIVTGDLVFTAGQGGVDPATRKVVEGGIAEQTRQTLRNITAILDAAGSSMARVVKTTVFLQDIKDFAAMNAVYAEFFPQDPPARTTVQVAALPMGILVEIEAVAVKG
ncbi:MAG: RidA family protein [Chloroflexi bacterium]|nr:RidA family protein [Chloroflexota bacterium]